MSTRRYRRSPEGALPHSDTDAKCSPIVGPCEIPVADRPFGFLRPVDAERRVVPADAGGCVCDIWVGDHVEHLGAVDQRLEAVCKALGNVKGRATIRVELDANPLRVGW